jgi:hypothetical protein
MSASDAPRRTIPHMDMDEQTLAKHRNDNELPKLATPNKAMADPRRKKLLNDTELPN